MFVVFSRLFKLLFWAFTKISNGFYDDLMRSHGKFEHFYETKRRQTPQTEPNFDLLQQRFFSMFQIKNL